MTAAWPAEAPGALHGEVYGPTMGVRLGFSPFTFDRDERVLRRDGRMVPLAPKVAEALALLLAEPGALVEKNALRDALWPEGFVEDGNLTQTIYLIRRALDPDGDGRAFVETVPKRGYRFVAPVTVLADAPPGRGMRERARFALRSAAALVAFAFASGGASVGSGWWLNPPALTGEAARAYAVGEYDWNRRTEPMLRAAMEQFTRVIELVPDDARGYAGLAAAYVTAGDWHYDRIAPTDVAFRKAAEYAHEALRRDPHSGEAMTSLGWIALARDVDLDRAERIFTTAIALRPNYAPTYEFMGIVHLYRGDAESARTMLRRATELDPLSPIDLYWYGSSLYYAHRFAEARTALRGVLDLDAQNASAHEVLALADTELGLRDEALHVIEHMPPKSMQEDSYTHREMAMAFTAMRTGQRLQRLPDLRPRDPQHVDTEMAAALCILLGRRDNALAWLRLGLRDPKARIERKMLALDPRFAAVHDDARFRALWS